MVWCLCTRLNGCYELHTRTYATKVNSFHQRVLTTVTIYRDTKQTYMYIYYILRGCIKGAACAVFVIQHSYCMEQCRVPCLCCTVLPARDHIKGTSGC